MKDQDSIQNHPFSNLFFFPGLERVLPQRVRARPGVQLLQGLHDRGRDVPGGRAAGDKPDQSPQAASHHQLIRVRITLHIPPPSLASESHTLTHGTVQALFLCSPFWS